MGFTYTPPQRDRVSKSVPRSAPNRRVDQTIAHISSGWLPVNPQVLKHVQDQLNQGAYRQNPEKLIEDVKEDPGLFAHAARSLKPLIEDLGTGFDPLDALKKLEEDNLKKIFTGNERQLSEHRFNKMQRIQWVRYQHSVIRARSAEALAPKVELSPTLAFSAAQTQSIGDMLVVHNYPDIYARALAAQRTKGSDMNFELRKYLGVTPLQISAKFASDWNLTPEIRAVLQTPSVNPRPKEEEELANNEGGPRLTLGKVCQISELFAQANDPEHYPKAAETWKATEAQLPDLITPDFFKQIEGPVQNVMRLCSDVSSKKLTPVYFYRPPEPGMSERAKALFLGNLWIKRCPPPLQDLFFSAYEGISQEYISEDALQVLVGEVIPAAGFVRGALFMLDEKSLMLNPVMRVGEIALDKYPKVALHENHPVAQSLASQVAFKQESIGLFGDSVVHVCGSLGPTNRPGVIYLESDRNENDHLPSGRINSFQAIKQCLIDCLGKSIAIKKKPAKQNLG